MQPEADKPALTPRASGISDLVTSFATFRTGRARKGGAWRASGSMRLERLVNADQTLVVDLLSQAQYRVARARHDCGWTDLLSGSGSRVTLRGSSANSISIDRRLAESMSH